MSKKLLWTALGVTTIFSLWFSYNYFEKAIPFVNISITMNKQEAEQSARSLAEQYSWKTQDFDTAVYFKEDSKLQAFVELEGGGKQAYIDMIKQDHFQPYTWQVRSFKEHEIAETVVYFTPDGRKYGFKQKLPEDQEGEALQKSKAQKIAEDEATSWDIDLGPYKLVQHEQHVRPSKRVDHSFVYERSDRTIGKGLYRLTITVSGDEVTGIERSVKIPDEFNRRYAQMFSQNKLLAMLGQGISVLFYLFMIGLFGLLFLYRKRYLQTTLIMKMMAVFGALLFLASLNSWSLIWYFYPTNVSRFVFVIQSLGMKLIGIIMFTLVVSFICLVAEGLGRYLFGKHVQFFKLWTPESASSYTIVGQTVLGYCGAAIMMAYAVAFTLLANSWGWWSPLFTKVDPNILSNYVPFFSPFIDACRAGFWEEFATRALPIVGVLFLTRNSQHRWIWLVAVMLTQAILFGALHATYPMQPAYYRIVELMMPSLGFGFMYYYFGLLPGIITHMVYDAVLMLIPVFVSDLWIHKLLGVAAIGIPLWIVLFYVIQQGGLKLLSKSAYNDAWKPKEKEIVEKPFARIVGNVIPASIQQYMWVFGVVGLLLFVSSKEFQFITPPVTIEKQQAEKIAQQSIQERFGDIGSEWTVVTSFLNTVQTMENKFVWQTYGKQTYQALQGSYVTPPYYAVRYVKFDGPVEARAEEYGVWITGDGNVLNTWHTLPEAAHGADISESKAQSMAYEFIKDRYGLDKNNVDLVSSESTKHEHRRDWNIVIRDLANYKFDKGQARIAITIAGDEISHVRRFVYAPEEWQRSEQQRMVKVGILSMISYWLLFVLLCISVAFAYRRVGISKTLFSIMGTVGIIMFMIKVIEFINGWQQLLFILSTSETFMNQIVTMVTASMVGWIGTACTMGALIALTYLSGVRGVVKDRYQTMLTGIAIGCGVLGLYGFIGNIEPQFMARSPLYDFMNMQSLLVGSCLYMMTASLWAYIIFSGVRIVAFAMNSEYVKLLIFIGAGFAVTGMAGATQILWYWLLFSTLWGFVWYLLNRYVFAFNSELLLVTVVTMQILRLVPLLVYQAYPGALLGVVVSGVMLLSGSIYLSRRLQKL